MTHIDKIWWWNKECRSHLSRCYKMEYKSKTATAENKEGQLQSSKTKCIEKCCTDSNTGKNTERAFEWVGNLRLLVCHDFCMTICPGLTFLNVSNTRPVSHCTAICRVRRPSTWPTVALQSQTFLAYTTYAWPPVHTTPPAQYGRQAFSVAGPTVWNSLPDSLLWPSSQQQQLQATT